MGDRGGIAAICSTVHGHGTTFLVVKHKDQREQAGGITIHSHLTLPAGACGIMSNHLSPDDDAQAGRNKLS